MKKLQVLMPMGGLGSRFATAGYTTPKPLIEVDGMPMFMRALQSFQGFTGDISYIFVIRKEHDQAYKLADSIRRELPEAKIAILDHDTDGAVESSLIAESLIEDDTPISVMDCDIYFESSDYFNKINSLDKNNIDGMLLTFSADNPRYSYVEIDKTGKAVRTAEKKVISNNAILGGYFFRSGQLFRSVAHDFVDKPLPDDLKEYFMSHLFNMLLADGKHVEIANVDVMHIFGTPEELDAYKARSTNG